MQACKRCHRATADHGPFCTTCDHERIPESLLAPRELPTWSGRVAEVAVVVVGLWLLVTFGIAFLREAQALRWARTSLAMGDAERAYKLISPFLESHPSHVEALLLAGSAAIKTPRHQQAASLYSRLASLEGKGARARLEQLRKLHDEEIPRLASELPCGQTAFAQLFETFEGLGQDYLPTLLNAGARLTTQCALDSYRQRANEPAFWLIHTKELDPELVVTTLFLGPMAPALEGHQFLLARRLAEIGSSLWPEGTEQIESRLEKTRQRVGSTLGVLKDALTEVRQDPTFRTGRSPCFPPKPPAALAERRDAWGNRLLYSATSPSQQTQCFRAFALTSLGADGRQTPDDQSSPAMDFSCNVSRYGQERCNVRDRFWLPRQS